MSKMYLMSGLSGAGKTTYARMIADKMNLRYLGVDDFYAHINGDECIRENKFNVWIEFWKAIHNAEINNIDCVVDTNALTIHQRKEFIEWFPTFEHHLIYVYTDESQRYVNNKLRKRQVPNNVMAQMSKKLEVPNKETDSDWKTITYIMNLNHKFMRVQTINV